MSPRNADIAVWRFFDALAWNWLIGGTDAHAKNYSLLLAGGEVRLAPLYDVASGLPYGTHERKLRLAMKIGGDYRIFPFHNSWIKAAGEMGIDAGLAVDRVRELAGLVTEAFSEAAADSDVAALSRGLPGRLVDIIADRAARCARLIDADQGSPAR
jgi:serine/threonine-protein kinase HipA